MLVHSFHTVDGGRLDRRREMVRTDIEGKFEVVVPAGCERRIVVYETWTKDGQVHEEEFPADVADGLFEVLVE